MDDTEADFKDMTGAGLDEADIASITEVVDDIAVDEPIIADDDILPLVVVDDGSLSEEQVEEETDDMLEYIYGDSLTSR